MPKQCPIEHRVDFERSLGQPSKTCGTCSLPLSQRRAYPWLDIDVTQTLGTSAHLATAATGIGRPIASTGATLVESKPWVYKIPTIPVGATERPQEISIQSPRSSELDPGRMGHRGHVPSVEPLNRLSTAQRSTPKFKIN